MKIAIVDTYYPAFLDRERLTGMSYEDRLRCQLEECFGTYDCYSRGLRAVGWETLDIIANDGVLQSQWAREQGLGASAREGGLQYIAFEQIRLFKPDIVFMQDLTFFGWDYLAALKKKYIVAGQISCNLPSDQFLRQFDMLFTSLPHFVERIRPMCARTQFLPLAFDPIATIRAGGDARSRNGCVFIGSIGTQWSPEIRDVASRTAGVQLYDQGQRFGVEMYREFLRAEVVLNRHGFIAEGYANNLRLFEATGCGALLLTEDARNIRDYFDEGECVTYRTPQEAGTLIRYYLDHPELAAEIAARGQHRTLRDHTYSNRMPIVSEALKSMRVEHHPV